MRVALLERDQRHNLMHPDKHHAIFDCTEIKVRALDCRRCLVNDGLFPLLAVWRYGSIATTRQNDVSCIVGQSQSV